MRTLSIFTIASALVLGAGWNTWVRAEEPMPRVEAKELYLEAYTQRYLNPGAAKQKLERVVAGAPADYEYTQKAEQLLELIRADPQPGPVADQRRARPSARPEAPPSEVEKTHFPPPDPSTRLYVGPVITAREATAKGVNQFQKGKFEAALPFFLHAVELDPKGQALSHKMAGIAYARLGEKCQAARHYQAYAEAKPDAPDVPKIRQILSKYEEHGGDAKNCRNP